VVDQASLPDDRVDMIRAVWFFVALVAVLASSPAVKRFFQVDSCLDHGGRWNHDADT
jgi:hypothetical protein